MFAVFLMAASSACVGSYPQSKAQPLFTRSSQDQRATFLPQVIHLQKGRGRAGAAQEHPMYPAPHGMLFLHAQYVLASSLTAQGEAGGRIGTLWDPSLRTRDTTSMHKHAHAGANGSAQLTGLHTPHGMPPAMLMHTGTWKDGECRETSTVPTAALPNTATDPSPALPCKKIPAP